MEKLEEKYANIDLNKIMNTEIYRTKSLDGAITAAA